MPGTYHSLGTRVGTYSNASGLPQVPAGSGKIPQSLLNGVGRAIDGARVAPSEGSVFAQTAGGTTIDFNAIVEAASSGFQPHPFQIIPVGVASGSALDVQIAEGRIFGRVDWTTAEFKPGIPNASYAIPSIGTAGFDPAFSGVWNGPAPDTSGGQGGSKGPTGQVAGGGSVTNKPQSAGGGYVSGNAGSITSSGQTGGVYHNDFSVTGNGSYVGGNAGTFSSFGQGGIYSNQFNVTGNGTYVSGNAGSITSGGNQSGIYNPTLSPSFSTSP